jgi:hypothetical protein
MECSQSSVQFLLSGWSGVKRSSAQLQNQVALP